MHYIAPGKRNLVYHLLDEQAHEGRVLAEHRKDLMRWHIFELENTHKEFHESTTTSDSRS